MKKYKWISIVIALLMSAAYCFGQGTITKGLIGQEDIYWANGGGSTFTRGTSTGDTLTLTKVKKPATFFTPQMYGAKGDGSTTDTTAIQAAIDAAALLSVSAGSKYVIDGGGQTYKTGSLSVTTGVILNNIRLIPATAAIDIVKLAPGAEFWGIIDVTGLTFTGNAIVLNPDNHGGVCYDNTPGKKTYIRADLWGGITGTGLYYHTNDAVNPKYIAFVKADVNINGFNTAIDLHVETTAAPPANSFINGNIFNGVLRGHVTGVYLHPASRSICNEYNLVLQPVFGTSDRGLYFASGDYNRAVITPWDANSYSTALVEWGAGCGSYNQVFTNFGLTSSIYLKLVNNNADKLSNKLVTETTFNAQFWNYNLPSNHSEIWAGGLSQRLMFDFDTVSPLTYAETDSHEVLMLEDTGTAKKSKFNGFIETNKTTKTCVNGANADLAITGTFVHITGPSGVFNISGIAGGIQGRHVILRNASSQVLTLTHEDGGSVAGNRLNLPGGASATVTALYGSAHLMYDGNANRWYLISNN